MKMGRAEPIHVPGCWKLKLADPLLSGRKMPWQGYEELCIDKEEKTDRKKIS
jgi:hypothetical protein